MKINSLLLSYCAGYVCEPRMAGDNCEVNVEAVMHVATIIKGQLHEEMLPSKSLSG